MGMAVLLELKPTLAMLVLLEPDPPFPCSLEGVIESCSWLAQIWLLFGQLAIDE